MWQWLLCNPAASYRDFYKEYNFDYSLASIEGIKSIEEPVLDIVFQQEAPAYVEELCFTIIKSKGWLIPHEL